VTVNWRDELTAPLLQNCNRTKKPARSLAGGGFTRNPMQLFCRLFKRTLHPQLSSRGVEAVLHARAQKADGAGAVAQRGVSSTPVAADRTRDKPDQSDTARVGVFLDNAPYHHAKLVQEWLAQPGRRIKLHFIPSYCPHLNPIERLWGLMHKNVTHNRCYATCRQFADATLDFLRDKVPKNWRRCRDVVTDNFRVINPRIFGL
jgi:hypothetical protein